MSLQDQKVVVIGASSGIGLAIAKASAEAGAKVMLVGRSLESLNRAADAVGQGAQAISADTGNEEAITVLFEQVGTFNHLVITAADLAYAPIQDFDSADAHKIVNSKILGAFYVAKHAAPA